MTASSRGDGVGGATVRGALLVAAAVAVGVILLAQGFDSGTLPTSSDTPSEQASGNDDDDNGDGTEGNGDEASTTTTAPPTTHVPSEVRVQVLNSTGPSGAARTSSEALAALGYLLLDPADADDQAIPTTTVYVAAGYEADAAAIATALGITATVQAMPAPPPPPAPADALVVVVLGEDFTPPA